MGDCQLWVERVVLGLNLCPFAHAPWRAGRVRWQLCPAATLEDLLPVVEAELRLLHGQEAEHERPGPAFETTLLVLPNAPTVFDAFNDWVGLVEGLLPMLRLRGQIQVVGFHPGFVFDDLPPEDPGNGVNRSPWPMLHLLLESSISRVVDAGANIDAITERNQRVLRAQQSGS